MRVSGSFDAVTVAISRALSQLVPDPCQILRGTTGNTGEPVDRPYSPDAAPPQVNTRTNPKHPWLPKLRASAGCLVNRCFPTAQCVTDL